MATKSYIAPDAGNPAFVQRWMHPGRIFPRHAARILSVQRSVCRRIGTVSWETEMELLQHSTPEDVKRCLEVGLGRGQ